MATVDQDPDQEFESEDFDEQEIPMTAESLGGSGSVASLDTAIDGGLPLLLFHREYSQFQHVLDAMVELRRTASSSLNLALVLRLPAQTPEQATSDFDSTANVASVKIADPMCYTRSDAWGPRLLLERDGTGPPKEGAKVKGPLMRRESDWPYFVTAIGTDRGEWIQKVLDAQRAVGANLLLSSGMPLDSTTPDQALDLARSDLIETRGLLANGERLANNLTVGSEWLTNVKLRNKLLTHIVESDDDIWYIRVQWPSLTATYAQMLDFSALDGYKELSVLCQDEDKRLLLPNTGGTGWISVALGAVGFGTGIGSSARAFSTKKFTPMGGVPKTPRYFDRSLLHTITKVSEDALSRLAGSVACTCIFCDKLRDSAAWNSGLSAGHYLMQIGELTAKLSDASGGGKRGVARRIVRHARSYLAAALPMVPLDGSDYPSHVALWEERLK